MQYTHVLEKSPIFILHLKMLSLQQSEKIWINALSEAGELERTIKTITSMEIDSLVMDGESKKHLLNWYHVTAAKTNIFLLQLGHQEYEF